jgi:hypothetical protein
LQQVVTWPKPIPLLQVVGALGLSLFQQGLFPLQPVVVLQVLSPLLRAIVTLGLSQSQHSCYHSQIYPKLIKGLVEHMGFVLML